jgi:branched-chain amino acid transport system permease protein
MEFFFISLVSGIAIGSVWGLTGLAFTAIFNASRVINFGGGELCMVGAYAGSLLVFSGLVPLPIGLIGVVVLPIIAGIIINRVFVERTVRRKADTISSVLVTMAASLIVSGIIGFITKFQYFRTGLIFGNDSIRLGTFSISPQYLAIIIAFILLAVGYWFFLKKTRVGLGLQAAGINADMASQVGINMVLMRDLAWILSSAIGGIAGFLAAPIVVPTANMGGPLLVYGFIGAVLGGFGYPLAALAGGIILGLCIQFFTGYISAAHADLVIFIALLVVCAFRPTGILGLKMYE